MFIHDLKKKVGPIKYRNTNKNVAPKGNRSRKKEKNNISETKKIDPGKPKKIKIFNNVTRNNFGQIKFSPLISVIRRVLNRLAIASTNKKEFVEIKA